MVVIDTTTQLRDPLVAPTQRPNRQAGEASVAVNLLLTTLAVVAAMPFGQDEWPQLRARARVPVVDVAPNLLLSTLSPSSAPFAQDEWPLQQAVRRAQQLDIPQNLLPITAAPFRPVELPSPRAAARVSQFDAPNLLGTTLAPVVGQAPFSQTDWPIPRAAKRVSDSWVAQYPLTVTPVPGAAPFAQDEWPGLQARRIPQPDVVPNLLGTVLATVQAPAPFTQTNWPIPRAAARVPDPWFAPNLLTITPVPGAVPFRQLEWLGPRVARWQQPWATPNLLTGTLTPPVSAAAPFRQLEWPQLKRARFAVDAQGHVSIALTSAPAVPGVFPPDSPLHFRISVPTRRLGEVSETPGSERLGSASITPPNRRLGDDNA